MDPLKDPKKGSLIAWLFKQLWELRVDNHKFKKKRNYEKFSVRSEM